MNTPLTFATEWVKKRFISFTIDDLKQAYLTAGNKMPSDGSAWGNVLTSLQKSGAIFKHPTNPYTTTLRPNNKTKVINVWISKEYRLKQQKNASSEETLRLF